MNTQLINKINQFVTDNNNGMITGPVMNQVLKSMVTHQVAEVTYAQLAGYVTNSWVSPGTVYKVTDWGDRGIYLMGLPIKP